MDSLPLRKAKIRMMMSTPFFASLLLQMNTVETDSIPTAATDGVTLFVNPLYFEGLTVDEQVGLLAHEMMHPALGHHTRRNGRDPETWNEACDYVLNPILRDAGITLPKGGLLNASYEGKTADEVYKILETNKPPKGGGQGQAGAGRGWQPGDGFSGGMGDVMDFPDMGDEVAIVAEEARQLGNLSQDQTLAKNAGSGSGDLDRLIEDLLNPKVDWATQLRRLLSEKSFDDYTWAKPNRRYLQRGFYLPKLENEATGRVVVAVDTSMSIDQDELNRYASEIGQIGEISNGRVTAIYCDAKVRGVDHFEAGDTVELKAKGGGGTDFKPPFKWVEENDELPKLLLYFTDGYCSSFPNEPEYDVIWCVTTAKKAREFKPPFGEVIYIN